MEYTHVVHEFEPIYNEDSKVLILGSRVFSFGKVQSESVLLWASAESVLEGDGGSLWRGDSYDDRGKAGIFASESYRSVGRNRVL